MDIINLLVLDKSELVLLIGKKLCSKTTCKSWRLYNGGEISVAPVSGTHARDPRFNSQHGCRKWNGPWNIRLMSGKAHVKPNLICLRICVILDKQLAVIVDQLGVDLVPYIVLFIVPVLGRMSDQNQAVRLAACSVFATLIRLCRSGFYSNQTFISYKQWETDSILLLESVNR